MDKFEQPNIKRILQMKAAITKTPINGTFELTPMCNMDCKMCYIRMSREQAEAFGKHFTKDEWIELGRVCKEQGMLFLLLTGGEVFLLPDFKEIYIELSKMGFIISINTNGTLIDDEVISWLRQYPPSKLNITLYGGSDDTYRRLCGNPKGYTQTTAAIDKLLAEGISVYLNVSVTKENIEDLEQIYQFAKDRDIHVTTAPYMFPPVRNNRYAGDIRLTARQAGWALYQSKKCLMSEEQFRKMVSDVKTGTIEEVDNDCTRTKDEHMGCMAGKSSFWITWDGRMTPCGMLNNPSVDLRQTGFKEAFEQICEETHKIILPKKCGSCSKRHSCMVCGALAIAEGTGDSTRTPEYLCGMTEAYLDLLMQERLG